MAISKAVFPRRSGSRVEVQVEWGIASRVVLNMSGIIRDICTYFFVYICICLSWLWYICFMYFIGIWCAGDWKTIAVLPRIGYPKIHPLVNFLKYRIQYPYFMIGVLFGISLETPWEYQWGTGVALVGDTHTLKIQRMVIMLLKCGRSIVGLYLTVSVVKLKYCNQSTLDNICFTAPIHSKNGCRHTIYYWIYDILYNIWYIFYLL